MEPIVAYSQTSRTPEQQLEIDTCLRHNLNHPVINRMVLLTESDAMPEQQVTVPAEKVTIDERIIYADRCRRAPFQSPGKKHIARQGPQRTTRGKTVNTTKLHLLRTNRSEYCNLIHRRPPALERDRQSAQ